jgi:hypothetical protein
MWRFRRLRLFVSIVFRQADVESDGRPWYLPWSLSWEIANIMCNPHWEMETYPGRFPMDRKGH